MEQGRAVTPLHLYLQVLKGDKTLIYEIPRFYDFKGAFTPFVKTHVNSEMSRLLPEDPSKVGKTPDMLLNVFSLAGVGPCGDEKNLEYTKVRFAYDRYKKSLIRKGLEIFGLEQIPFALRDFERINRLAVDIDYYLGRIDGKYLHPDLFRPNFKEFF